MRQKDPHWTAQCLLIVTILVSCSAEDDQYQTHQRLDQRYRHDFNVAPTLPPGGPNVCRSKYGNSTSQYCCPGWSRHNILNLCIIPICTRPCGSGQCIRPNTCRCNGGVEGSSCHPQLHQSVGRFENQRSFGNRCQSICMNGGTCVEGKCSCAAGFTGSFCSEPICLEACKNGGRCIGPDRCACVYGYIGNHCEIDTRRGPCYTSIDSVCGDQLQGVVCTKTLCCATVGKAWGLPCEHCPLKMECDIGFLKNRNSGECVDIDECSAIPHLCEGGLCVNSIGSFTCECPDGQSRNPKTNQCDDKDECEDPDVCPDGQCVNIDRGYYCLCNPGFIQSQNRRYCIDGRQGLCFTHRSGQGYCRNSLPMRLSKKDCCCGVNMGQGWGENCTKCPLYGEDDHRLLCAGPQISDSETPGSQIIDGGHPPDAGNHLIEINECILRPDICGQGQCIDTSTGYFCKCKPGYRSGPHTQECEDIDECREGKCQNGRCTNTPGSFNCLCPPGFDVSPDGTICTDHDECKEIGMCTNGICINMDGSFKCQCKPGYTLSSSGYACRDIDECSENPLICLHGKCNNIAGGYTCTCLPGFIESSDKTFCSDMDECSTTLMCEHGKCVNVEGSFQCFCDPGYRLGPDRKHCVDINECLSNPCQFGTCTNMPGSFRCNCHPGFSLDPNGRTCMDTPRDLCYQDYVQGRCSNPSTTAVTRSSCCCCTVITGKQMGWGTNCDPCPVPGSTAFEHLCPHGAGSTFDGKDINECAQNPNICENGACENLIGTYRCICNPGFEPDGSGKFCTDINECFLEESVCSGGQCLNTAGSYQCLCPEGTRHNLHTSSCEDVDECREKGPESCFNGECINTYGSFKCECDPESILDSKGTTCIDNRKGSCWTKLNNGRCENNLPQLSKRTECCCSIGIAWGSPCEKCNRHECDCQKGFAKIDGKDCDDINECNLNPDICSGGGTCVNTEGSFTCTCPPGLTLDATKTRCLDTRIEQCYTKYKDGLCSNSVEGMFHKNLCCCTAIGRAWGEKCEQCPRVGTEDFTQLCPKGPGFIERIGLDLKDINECAEFPGICQNGICENTFGGFNCSCRKGFNYDENKIKCVDIDECSITTHNVCGNGKCKNTPGSFICECDEGFRSPPPPMQICMDINECEEMPGLCTGGGRCINTLGSFKCECPPGHELTPDKVACKDIDECSSSSGICSNGVCENMMGTYQCNCNEGYQHTIHKSHCEDINECDEEPCEDICINTPGSFACDCGPGYALNGTSCVNINECKENPRICNGGKCVDTLGSYMCHCAGGLIPGPTGTSCIDIDECKQNPNICGNGKCLNILGSFHCRCEEGYSVKPDSSAACTDDDECLYGDFDCDDNADCINNPGSYQCRCRDGFTGNGKKCRDIDECLTNNGGCHNNAQCINNDGSFKCICDAGYRGDGYSCSDIDECINDPSLCENGQCVNVPGSFTCECEMGFMHPTRDNDKECVDIDECTNFNNICVFGKCKNLFGKFQCECESGYKLDGSGGNCTDINECDSPQRCLYGTCTNLDGGFKCTCPPNHELVNEGNACIDRRLSRCYMHVDNQGRCSEPSADYVTQSSCCCSVGKAWGTQCELCPSQDSEEYQEICPGGIGYRPNDKTVVLEDINECEEHENICQNGHCTNTFGSFMCLCNEGFRLDQTGFTCVDINECEENPNICSVGACVNEPGKYYCECPVGYMPLPGKKECVDMRKDSCFLHYSRWGCTQAMSQNQTKKLCCCSMGQAWGQPCEPCPLAGTNEHVALCGVKPGQIINPMTNQTEEIDECELMPTMCKHGQCMNTPGSFECQCNQGYVYDINSHQCIDDNECLKNPCSGNAQCINRPGSFECKCPEGYKHGTSFMDCEDINECVERPNICQNGECNNLQGSFQCLCHPGYQLTSYRDSCSDMDECSTRPNICNNGTCVNSAGAYKCYCNPGFKLDQNNVCVDIDECHMSPNLCRNGRCRNNLGSFSCECANGYTLSADGKHCRDIDECTEIRGTCPPPGKCTNVMGSFLCACPEGYELSSVTKMCEDIDECEMNPNACENGQCTNTDGGAFCTCPKGFTIEPNMMKCIDTRQDQCFDTFARGRCLDPRGMYISLKECCCSKGAAWGRACERCPVEGTGEFQKLCPEGLGRLESGNDINECEIMPNICERGECINTDGSFRCECPKGLVLDGSGKKCIDENECVSNPNICGNGTCTNVWGSFECQCSDGFQPGTNQICEDINECLDFSNNCAFRCHNIPGSYRCICPYGYTLAADGIHCEDVNECETPANNCKYQCKNLIGRFMCICPEGYTQVHGRDDCRDIDECSADPNICQHGRCVNSEGSYRCDCIEGFEPTADRKKCIDRRKETCYTQVDYYGRCVSTTHHDSKRVTKTDCCCSMGRAWGPKCEYCPERHTSQHRELCGQSGFTIEGQDINECDTIAGLCENGECINTLGSYKCSCHKGFKADETKTHCLDKNECEMSLCEFKCLNTQGSFKCSCPSGYLLNQDGLTCKDIDECASSQHTCQHKCINTKGSYDCACEDGYRQQGDECLDINECESQNICLLGKCINTLGSFKCICPRGFKYDNVTGACLDNNECIDDSRCNEACQNYAGGYKCGCPEGFIPHFNNKCIDMNECQNNSPCGAAACFNTPGSYRCQCPNGYQFNTQLSICVEASGSGCANSACSFGCNGNDCGCPSGYNVIEQGHCFSYAPPAGGSSTEDIGDVPVYPIPSSSKKLAATEGCFSCRINGRHRRNSKHRRHHAVSNYTDVVNHVFIRSRRHRRHHHGDELELQFTIDQTKHKARLIKLQPAVKVNDLQYVIKSGNENNKFELTKKHGIWGLNFKRRQKSPAVFHLIIQGKSADTDAEEGFENETFIKPLSLHLRVIVTL